MYELLFLSIFVILVLIKKKTFTQLECFEYFQFILLLFAKLKMISDTKNKFIDKKKHLYMFTLLIGHQLMSNTVKFLSVHYTIDSLITAKFFLFSNNFQ